MIGLAPGVRVLLAVAPTDLRRGFDGLAALVQGALQENPFSGHLFVFRGKRGDRLKILYWDGSGLCLFAKRLERGSFLWPRPGEDKITLTPLQLGLMIDGLDWSKVKQRIVKTPIAAA